MKKREWMLRAERSMLVAMCLLMAGCGDGKKSRQDISFLLRSGQEQMQKGRYREAIASFLEAKRLDPEAPEPYMRLALIYEECLHDSAMALHYYRRYQKVEKDNVKKEEVRGWIVQLEREAGEAGEGRRTATLPGEEASDGEAGTAVPGSVGSNGPSDTAISVPIEESLAYKDLQARLTSALSEIRRLKAQAEPEANPSEKLAEAEQRVKKLQSEKELLAKNLQNARADVLRNQQTVLQEQKKTDTLRNAYEAQIADLKRGLNTGETEQIARLEKTVKTYAATLSSLQKVNDELRKENASLRSRLRRAGGLARRHTVREGETLKKIAAYPSVYGDSKKWVVIYQANRDKVRDPNTLKPGLVLVIPPG